MNSTWVLVTVMSAVEVVGAAASTIDTPTPFSTDVADVTGEPDTVGDVAGAVTGVVEFTGEMDRVVDAADVGADTGVVVVVVVVLHAVAMLARATRTLTVRRRVA